MIHRLVRDDTLHSRLLLLVLALGLALASSAHARSDDRNHPLTADSDRNDCIIEDGAPCMLVGNVHIRQGSLDIRAERADLRLAEGEVRSVLLTGAPVQMTQQTDSGGTVNADAQEVHYDLTTEIITLTKQAQVQQPGRSSIAGERIVYNARTHQVQGGGEGSGRVRLQFEPQNRADDASDNGNQP